jgi:predicted enzyme related to lactoylglutathione lyase
MREDNLSTRRNFLTLSVVGAAMAATSFMPTAYAQQVKTQKEEIYPRTITHIGLTVPDINAALKWYGKVFGWTVLMEPAASVAGKGYMGELAANLYGREFKENRMAMMSTGNACNVEFFEYIEPPSKKFMQESKPWKPGWWHICVLDPDIEGMVKRVVDNGGKQISKIWETAPGSDLPFKICYTQDPWGNYIEVSSRSAEFMMGPR